MRRREAWLVIPVEGGHALVPDLPPRRRPVAQIPRLDRVCPYTQPPALAARARVSAELHELLAAGPPAPPDRIVGYPGRPNFDAPPAPPLVSWEELVGGRGCGEITIDEDGGGSQ